MSLNTVIAFALLLKKITQNRSIGKNFKTTKKRKDPHSVSSSCSSSTSISDDEYIEEMEEEDFKQVDKSTSSIIAASIKSITPSHQKIKDALNTPLDNVQTMDVSDLDMKQNNDQFSYDVIIRDFAYPTDSPLHHGKSLTLLNQSSTISLSSPEFNGRDARVLFDFIPETEYEVGLKAGQIIWVQYRQCPGWLIADVLDETGLVPESYVELI